MRDQWFLFFVFVLFFIRFPYVFFLCIFGSIFNAIGHIQVWFYWFLFTHYIVMCVCVKSGQVAMACHLHSLFLSVCVSVCLSQTKKKFFFRHYKWSVAVICWWWPNRMKIHFTFFSIFFIADVNDLRIKFLIIQYLIGHWTMDFCVLCSVQSILVFFSSVNLCNANNKQTNETRNPFVTVQTFIIVIYEWFVQR